VIHRELATGPADLRSERVRVVEDYRRRGVELSCDPGNFIRKHLPRLLARFRGAVPRLTRSDQNLLPQSAIAEQCLHAQGQSSVCFAVTFTLALPPQTTPLQLHNGVAQLVSTRVRNPTAQSGFSPGARSSSWVTIIR
jgi:hypothetical protein